MSKIIVIAIALMLAVNVSAGIPILGNEDFQVDANLFACVPVSLKYSEIGMGAGITLLDWNKTISFGAMGLQFGERKVAGAGFSYNTGPIKTFEIFKASIIAWGGWGYDYTPYLNPNDGGKWSWGGFDTGFGLKLPIPQN